MKRNGKQQEADQLWGELARQGDNEALFRLGLSAERRGDLAKAEVHYLASAESGNNLAMLALGLIYETKDSPDAEKWYRIAAECDTPSAILRLAYLLEAKGNVAEAVLFFQRGAVESGDPDAMNTLGTIYHESGDHDLATDWWERAAEQGDADAMNNLGAHCAEEGRKRDALQWFGRAADLGNLAALRNLERLLADES